MLTFQLYGLFEICFFYVIFNFTNALCLNFFFFHFPRFNRFRHILYRLWPHIASFDQRKFFCLRVCAFWGRWASTIFRSSEFFFPNFSKKFFSAEGFLLRHCFFPRVKFSDWNFYILLYYIVVSRVDLVFSTPLCFFGLIFSFDFFWSFFERCIASGANLIIASALDPFFYICEASPSVCSKVMLEILFFFNLKTTVSNLW